MNIPKAFGQLRYHVNVICPHCTGRLDLTQFPYDQDHRFYEAAFVDMTIGVSEGLEYECYHCKKRFILIGWSIQTPNPSFKPTASTDDGSSGTP